MGQEFGSRAIIAFFQIFVLVSDLFWEVHVRREAPERIFCHPPLHFFGFTSTISRFGKRFRVVSTVCHFLVFVLLTLGAPVPWMESCLYQDTDMVKLLCCAVHNTTVPTSA